MNVKELKLALELYSDDTEIILSSDAEGNKYSPLSGMEDGAYTPQTTWKGEFIEGSKTGITAIALFPIN